MVLVVVSGFLLLSDRPMPTDFGAVPGDRPAGSVANGPSAAGLLARPTGPSTSADSIPSSAVPTTEPATAAHPTTAHPTIAATPVRRPAPARSTTAQSPPTRSTPARSTPAHSTPAHATPAMVPQRLTLRRFGVIADVLPVTARDGALQVPEDPAQVGWWVGSALPGSPAGTTVLDGHINSAAAGPGAFLQLSELTAGDRVQLQRSTGVLSYDVVARRVFAKSQGLPSSLFGLAGAPRLLLISCGGPFDADRGSYQDNIVVFAVPAA